MERSQEPPLVFRATEYRADTSLGAVELTLEGSATDGWRVEREGAPHLELGPGYGLLRAHSCGVCSTDLARHHLPFPLPQVTGHEVVALDAAGRRFVVEINASHASRGVESDCPFCSSGLERHCPERLVLGIHDLPGGFGPWMLVPVCAALPIPETLSNETAVLLEPFAAALRAVERIAPRNGDRVGVLGPRRLGLLVVAALAGHRRRSGTQFEIVALSRHAELNTLARELGATDAALVRDDGAGLADGLVDVVVDTTGSPAALPLAVRLARREVHLKSTHGREACGLAHLTELVVDELALARLDGEPRGRVVRLANGDPAALFAALERDTAPGELPRANAAIARSASEVDHAIRPVPGRQASLVRPGGTIHLAPDADTDGSPLLEAIHGRGLLLTSSRCGDFRHALELLASDTELRTLGSRFVTHRFPVTELEAAFRTARTPDCIKAVVEHEVG